MIEPLDEVISEAAAGAVIAEVADVVERYSSRAITTGEALDRIGQMGREATRLRLTGWGFHDELRAA